MMFLHSSCSVSTPTHLPTDHKVTTFPEKPNIFVCQDKPWEIKADKNFITQEETNFSKLLALKFFITNVILLLLKVYADVSCVMSWVIKGQFKVQCHELFIGFTAKNKFKMYL